MRSSVGRGSRIQDRCCRGGGLRSHSRGDPPVLVVGLRFGQLHRRRVCPGVGGSRELGDGYRSSGGCSLCVRCTCVDGSQSRPGVAPARPAPPADGPAWGPRGSGAIAGAGPDDARAGARLDPVLHAGNTDSGSMSRTVAVIGLMVAMLWLAAGAQAAAPDYMMVSCPSLKRPVLLGDWNENAAFLLATAGAPKAKRDVVRGLARRPRCDLAEFWAWTGKPRPTRPAQANQHGWFYPARRGQPAVLHLMVDGVRIPRIAPTRALRILARHGVPTRA
jgi:hypothetical protein